MISIIVPVYNAEKYIKKCIESLLGQTYQNIEIIIVDDCGKDRSMQKVAKIIGCDHSSIDKILNRHNIKRFTLSESVATTNIIIERDDFKKIFSNTRDCGKWFIDNNYTRSKNINNVIHYLRECLRKNKPYCNFKVYYESKI